MNRRPQTQTADADRSVSREAQTSLHRLTSASSKEVERHNWTIVREEADHLKPTGTAPNSAIRRNAACLPPMTSTETHQRTRRKEKSGLCGPNSPYVYMNTGKTNEVCVASVSYTAQSNFSASSWLPTRSNWKVEPRGAERFQHWMDYTTIPSRSNL